jgi:hypothetical protein
MPWRQLDRGEGVFRFVTSAVREIRRLRSTGRELETWHGLRQNIVTVDMTL